MLKDLLLAPGKDYSHLPRTIRKKIYIISINNDNENRGGESIYILCLSKSLNACDKKNALVKVIALNSFTQVKSYPKDDPLFYTELHNSEVQKAPLQATTTKE